MPSAQLGVALAPLTPPELELQTDERRPPVLPVARDAADAVAVSSGVESNAAVAVRTGPGSATASFGGYSSHRSCADLDLAWVNYQPSVPRQVAPVGDVAGKEVSAIPLPEAQMAS
uniref:(northern house mosquito) hypothetical protein n=1 Tax=Culex pipiens TaxID=7175 RepID=A0A8D8KIJ4_CULPI